MIQRIHVPCRNSSLRMRCHGGAGLRTCSIASSCCLPAYLRAHETFTAHMPGICKQQSHGCPPTHLHIDRSSHCCLYQELMDASSQGEHGKLGKSTFTVNRKHHNQTRNSGGNSHAYHSPRQQLISVSTPIPGLSKPSRR